MFAIRLNLTENHKIVLKMFANSYFFTLSIIQTVMHDHLEIFFGGKLRKISFCMKNDAFCIISFIWYLIADIIKEWISCLWPWFTQPNLGQIQLPGGVLESSGQADSKTVPGFDDWPRFEGVIEQNKISHSFCHYCTNHHL